MPGAFRGDRGVDKCGCDLAGAGAGAGVAVHPRSDGRPVVERRELPAEMFGINHFRFSREIGEERSDRVAVRVGGFVGG
jgi:hypothetical protein